MVPLAKLFRLEADGEEEEEEEAAEAVMKKEEEEALTLEMPVGHGCRCHSSVVTTRHYSSLELLLAG